MNRNIVLAVAVGLAVGAGGWIAYALSLHALFGGDSSGASGNADGRSQTGQLDGETGRPRVKALGRIEPAGGIVNVGALPGDRLGDWKVKAGDPPMPAGAVLVDLDSRQLRQHELDAAQSELAAARKRLAAELKAANAQLSVARLARKQADREQPPALAAQKLKIAALRKKLALAERDSRRVSKLSENLVSDQEKERFALLVGSAKAELEAANAELQQINQVHRLKRDAAIADLQAAEAGIDRIESSIPIELLERKVKLAQLQLDQTQIRAPIKGTILKILSRQGELTGTMPILRMASLDNMVVVAEVYQSDVKRIDGGEAAVMRSPAFGPPYHDPENSGKSSGITGKVIRIGQVISRPDMQRLDPSAASDQRSVQVRIAIDPSCREQAARLINLQVEVTIFLNDEAR